MDNRYTIRQLSQFTGISLHTLRYYEKEGILQEIGRLRNGHRIYEERDLAWLQLVARLRKTGMSISHMKQLAEWRIRGAGTLSDRRSILEQHREKLQRHIAEMQDNLAALNREIELNQALDDDNSDILRAYYAQRAAHYERVYFRDDPVRQKELLAIENDLSRALTGKQVLEIACGTGYWTQKAARTAHITGIDASPEALKIAMHKGLGPEQATFLDGDAYTLQAVPGTFNAALAMFWFSHVPKSQILSFLNGLHQRIEARAVVYMADNVLNPGIGGELLVKPGKADTYKRRELPDGSKHEILKNYYTPKELRDIFEPFSTELNITVGDCYWWLSYRVK
ncbi:MerR family transcriptional regulator [Paenibacillus hodogayensis]|uniref:MerR family transcriptional regulator n=1 Tax=Paenibacillus hodogayensis TaxID=279208 RepID=A0ABV5VYZ9_9BACL